MLMYQVQRAEECYSRRAQEHDKPATILQLKAWQNCPTTSGFGKHC